MNSPAANALTEENTNPVRTYDVQFYLENGEGVFKIYLNGQAIGDKLYVNPEEYAILDLEFRLQGQGGASSAVWADAFVWPNGQPGFLGFASLAPTMAKVTDNVAQGLNTETCFLFAAVLDGKTYYSDDPIIINKKPPVEDEKD